MHPLPPMRKVWDVSFEDQSKAKSKAGGSDSRLRATLVGHKGPLSAVRMLETHRRIVTGSEDNIVKVSAM